MLSMDNTKRRRFGSTIECPVREISGEEAQELMVRTLSIDQG